MDDRTGNRQETSFSKADALMGGLSAETVCDLMQAAADVTLIVAKDGTIRDAAFQSKDLFVGGGQGWIGRNINEVITRECKHKVDQLINDAQSRVSGYSREVNHPILEGDDLPVSYRAARLNDEGDVVLFGQDIAKIALLQRRLMNSQLSMEREVSRLRGAESRYRAVFQSSDLATIVVDPESLRVVDINDAALRILGRGRQRLDNVKILQLFEESDSDLVHKLMLATLDGGNSEEVTIEIPGGENLKITATSFAQERKTYFLLSLRSDSGNVVNFSNSVDRKVQALLQQMPDAFVMTDASHRVLTVNEAFLDLFNFASVREVEGTPIDRLFERPSVDYNVLVSNLKEHNTVRRFATVVRSALGQTEKVEMAASRLEFHGEPIFGFAIRSMGNVSLPVEVESENVSRSNEQIANLVGHMPLKDIVRQTTELIEKLCIETALELTQNNRASAAQMLGVSRQSLYSKLGRNKEDD